MITFRIFESKTFYEGPEEELKVMYECLKIKDKNAWFKAKFLLRKLGYFHKPSDRESKKQYEKIVEGASWKKFYNSRSSYFGTGLLGRVKKHLRENGIEYRKKERRKPRLEFSRKNIGFHFVDKIESRPEQQAILEAALKSGYGILHCATNAGKTEIACGIISSFIKQTGRVPRTLFLVHLKGLAEQTRIRFEKHLGFKVAQFGGGGKKKLRRVVVATTQTAGILVENNSAKFLEFLQECDIVIVDECHINKASQVELILNSCRARMRFGLSGTIDKKNENKMLHYTGLLGPIIYEIRNKELVKLGRSAKPILRLVTVHGNKIEGEFRSSYDLAISESKTRNKLIVKEAIRYVNKDYRTIITVARVSHGYRLLNMLEKKVDVPVKYMHGSTSMHTRRKYLRQFEQGKIPILIASKIMGIGMDVPAIDAAVIAGGMKGWESVLQLLGRFLRRKEGRNVVRITDFLDVRNEYTKEHSIQRLEHYLNEEICEIRFVK